MTSGLFTLYPMDDKINLHYLEGGTVGGRNRYLRENE